MISDDGLVIKDNCVIRYVGDGGEVNIPEGVTAIKGGVLSGGWSFTSITIPSTLTEITEGLHNDFFSDFTNLVNNSSLSTDLIAKQLGVKFNDEEPEPNIEINNVTIDKIIYALYDNNTCAVIGTESDITGDIVVPSTIQYDNVTYDVKSISEAAFIGSNCTSIVVSKGITTIGMYAFLSCPKLTSVTLPSSLTEIVMSDNRYINPTHAYLQIENFINKSNIADDEAAGKLGISFCERRTDDGLVINGTFIEAYLNYGYNLSLNIPEGITGAQFSVLISNKTFTSITIPSTFTLGYSSYPRGISYALRSGFKNNTNYPDEEVAAYLGVLLVDVITADGFIIDGNAVVGYIGDSKTIVIPDGIEKINNSAFYQKDVTTITLPRTLSVIDDYAFYNCDGISDITLLSETPPVMGVSVFISSIYNKASLNVPYFSVNAYKSAPEWKKFRNIVGFVPEGYYLHHYFNCKDVELTGDENAYITQDDSEKRYVNGDGHEYDSNGMCKHCGQPKKCAKPTYDAENGLRCKTEGVQYEIKSGYWIATSPEMPTDISLTIIAKKDGYIDSAPLLLSISKLDLNNDGKFDLNDLKYLQDKVLEKE